MSDVLIILMEGARQNTGSYAALELPAWARTEDGARGIVDLFVAEAERSGAPFERPPKLYRSEIGDNTDAWIALGKIPTASGPPPVVVNIENVMPAAERRHVTFERDANGQATGAVVTVAHA